MNNANTSKRLTKRQQRSVETRQKIYDVAMILINQYGYENVTINDICTNADVTVGSFYHHFESKDGILVKCLEDEDCSVIQILANSKEKSIISRFKELFLSRVYLITIEKSVDFSIDCTIAHLRNRILGSYSPEREFYKALYQIVIEGQQKGVFKKDIDPGVFVESVLFNIGGLTLSWQLSNGTYPIEEKATQQFDLFLQMITNVNSEG